MTDRHLPALILIPGGSYGMLGALLRNLSHAFRSLGRPVVEIEAHDPEWTVRLLEALGRGVAFGVGMSGIGIDLEVRLTGGDKARLWSQVTTPFFSWHCDHPTYYSPRHTLSDPWIIHGYVFPDHARFQREHGRSTSMVANVHLGFPDLQRYPKDSADRPVDRILFAKSGSNPAALTQHWRERFPAIICKLLHDSVDALDELGGHRHVEAVIKAGAAHGIQVDPRSQLGYILIAQVDDYVRHRNATRVVERLLHRPADIYGKGWEHLSAKATHARFHGPVDFDESVRLVRSRRVSVNVNPCVNEAAHDRFHFALAAGAIPVSDHNAFIRTYFPSLAPYGFEFNAASIDQALDRAWADRKLAAQKVADAAAVSAEKFSFTVAARQIEAACEALRFANQPSGLPIYVLPPDLPT